jgi:hypothetical protein
LAGVLLVVKVRLGEKVRLVEKVRLGNNFRLGEKDTGRKSDWEISQTGR